MKKKPTPKATTRNPPSSVAGPRTIEERVEEAARRVPRGPMPTLPRRAPTHDEVVAREYAFRIENIKDALDLHARFLTSPNVESRELAHRFIDDIAAIVTGVGRRQRLRSELLQSLDSACFFAPSKTDSTDAGTLEFFIRVLEPELQAISRDDAAMALAVWRDDWTKTRPRPKNLPSKWKFLADLIERLGLGDVKPDSLQRDWQKWAQENLRYRDIKEHGSAVAAYRAKGLA